MAHILPTDLTQNCTSGIWHCTAQWADSVTGGFFWFAMLLGFCIAIIMSSYRAGMARAFGFASFVAITGSVFLAIMQLMAWWLASLLIITGLIGLVGLVMNRK